MEKETIDLKDLLFAYDFVARQHLNKESLEVIKKAEEVQLLILNKIETLLK